MVSSSICHLFLLMNIFTLIPSGLTKYLGDMTEIKILNVGEELWQETMPLKSGSCIYKLNGLKSHTGYEVKISYPATIPSSFSLQLTRGNSSSGRKSNRKLLNTEKLMFRTESLSKSKDQDELYVEVTVEPEGVVALAHGQERKEAIFNIVCDELLYGIPRFSWSVVILVILCLVLAIVIPCFLPSYLLGFDDGNPESASRVISKDS